ncbi:MAG TPA: TetR/AcrR family transcriptional regulator [Deltaproteobacteria bacterium]|jgi:AcrR family transcriptional regulator|nr:TetR/AcrR family transcriptional regulator [Deltaproteobacteria bacterium]HRW79865.1 TetR/AcrR family transcriptional regulator [Desulfomonilia bacterium]HNQ85356.1 TetR/AcrR family transcriptional regulator [Deltaproteobacteria bacterium]HNS89368.1 TetR/AcrR family transcriptional regulator [Deltaproteobacteria bacterium]HOA44004.1 TetR/AcrR family transcriptional regulator [Deltaproteobacteria bacterium]
MARKKVQEERKRQILKALDECLQEKSFEKTSIKDIARVAGVNHGVLHYYFTGKEDILLNYIDYVIADYQGQAREWLGSKDLSTYTKTGFIDEVFGFINNRITLNRGLSRIFVEIWEISLYNGEVRAKLREAYLRWIDEMGSMISGYIDDKDFARNMSIAMVAFWEGMALFSTIFPSGSLGIEEVIRRFQQRIIEIL